MSGKREEGEEGNGMTAFGGVPVTNPTLAWKILAPSQVHKPYKTPEASTPKPDGAVRLVCISDTHSMHNHETRVEIPDGDILIHAGDFSNTGKKKEIASFNKWLGTLPHAHKIVIAGNHDTILHDEYYQRGGWKRFHRSNEGTAEECRALFTNCTYLEDSGCEAMGLSFYGSPWQPEFCEWAFNLDRGPDLVEKWKKIPAGVDVLITHGPPIGHGDRCSGGNLAGCVNLLEEVQTRVKPRYHVFGHIHEGYGATTDGSTVYINASTCTSGYAPTHPPIIIDIVPHTSAK